jgi:hypothetical protein
MMYRDHCTECGQFISYDSRESVFYAPYNFATYEEPDNRYICMRCWGNMPVSRRHLIGRIAWRACSLICDVEGSGQRNPSFGRMTT